MIQPHEISVNNRFIARNDALVFITINNLYYWVENCNALTGIPLSIQFLLDQGCEPSGNFPNTVHIKPGIKITEKLGVFSVYKFDVHLVDIHFVHQFQNLLRALILKIGEV